MAYRKSEYMVKRYIAWLLVITLVGLFLYGCTVKADDLHEDEGYDSPDVLVNIYEKGKVKEVSHGTGFFISPTHLITAAHVVMNKKSDGLVQVVTRNGVSKYAEVLWYSKDRDIALLKVKEQISTPAPVSCTIPEFGQEVFAEGYPYELGYARTHGKVIGYKRDVSAGAVTWRYGIPFDATVGPGMSGGPVWSGGKVVGIIVGMRNAGMGAPSGFALFTAAYSFCDLLAWD